MKRPMIACFILIMVWGISAKSFAGANLVLSASPGFFLYSPDAEGFKASDGWKTDEVEGYFSNIATVSAGVGIDTPALFFDITGGIGYMWSSSITSTVLLGDLACRFKLRRDEMTLGPHITFLKFSPDWDSSADISLSDETGIAGGLSFLGTPKNSGSFRISGARRSRSMRFTTIIRSKNRAEMRFGG